MDIDVNKVAMLARIRLTDDEAAERRQPDHCRRTQPDLQSIDGRSDGHRHEHQAEGGNDRIRIEVDEQR